MAVRKQAGPELAQGGNWLFKQGGLVLGPIPAGAIVERLYRGELDGRSEIAVMGNPTFRPLATVDFFKVHLAKAEAKHRVDKIARAHQVKSARSRNVKIGVVIGICTVVAGIAGTAAWYLAIHKPWADADELAFAEISVDPPTIALAKRHSTEELVDYPSDGTDKTGKRVADKGKTETGKTKLAQKTSRSTEAAEPDGMRTEMFDRSAINGVVASRQKSLYPCLIEEAKKRPGLSAKIPIEFVIGNEGRVTKLWVDNPDFKTGSLPDCMLKELQKWPFKAYSGEQATVGLSFRIGKGG